MMDQETDQIKQLIMYANDAVEGTFIDGSKIFLSPCATEYVIQQGNHNQGMMTTKHRTVYTTSTFLPRIRALISFRNLYAEKPFLVPSLIDSTKCFQSSGTASHVRWSPNASHPTIDSTLTWSWTSLCGRAKIEIPFCRQIIYITHPLQVSRILSPSHDETNMPSKYIHIFAPVRRCFSSQRLPAYLSKFVCQCLQLIDGSATNCSTDFDDWSFQLPLPLPSTSCPQAHRHRLHHQMMLESDLKVLQTSNIVYRFEYDQPAKIEAMINDETTQILTEYIQIRDIRSTFYDHYSIKDQRCQCLTLSEHALPPQNERLTQLIRFMATMRQSLLTMARRVQEKPCWIIDDEHEDSIHSNPMIDSLHDETNRSSDLFDDEIESIYRQTSVDDVGNFKYFHDNRIQIEFHNGFTLDMTTEQVEFCQKNPLINIQCRIIDKRKKNLIEIFDGLGQPGCYEKYIQAARDWCLWVLDEKRKDEEEQLAANVQEELFRLKLFRNRAEIKEYQRTPSQPQQQQRTTSSSTVSYTPDEIQKILQRTAQFTRT